MTTPLVTLRDHLALAAPASIPHGFQHVSKPKPEVIEAVGGEFDPTDPFRRPALTPEQEEHNKRAMESYEAERLWQQQDERDRHAQWRYAWADSMMASRGERGRVDDITQVAQSILPALVQAHAARNVGSQPARHPDDDAGEQDLFAIAQISGWGSSYEKVCFKDDEKAEWASVAEIFAMDAFTLAEALIEVRRRRYGA